MKHTRLLSAAALAFCAISLQAQDFRGLIADYMAQSPEFRLTQNENRSFVIKNEDNSKSLRGTILQIQQVYNKIPVFGSVASALVQDNKVVYFTDNFQKSAAGTAAAVSQNAAQVFEKVQQQMNLGSTYSFDPKVENSVINKLVYMPVNNELRLAYEYEFAEKDSDNYWNIVADINTGEILSRQNLTLSCSFTDHPYGRHQHEDDAEHQFVGPILHSDDVEQSTFIAPSNATYNVFKFPLEAPSFGKRSIVSNPWDLTASPEGWHSTINNSYTITRGNNVYAYVDANSTNAVGNVADGGSSLNFDFPLDVNSPYLLYEKAAITNLFYANNMIHDIMYKFGFNEAARNFQTNNFGKGGSGNDAVLAEARDGSTKSSMNLNNANFNTPSDGSAGRMQMYLWNPKYINRLFFNTQLTSLYPNTQQASFGPLLNTTGVTGDLEKTTPTDGCSAISEDLTGKIGLIVNSTGCNFTTKVKNAQLKGAKGVVIYNPSTITNFGQMTGSDSSITIPSILVESATGTSILSKMASATVNVTLKDDKQQYVYIDGDLDNGIIIHEYGHGVSNRNTGNGYSCLSSSNSNEQMGEGWSDFFALMLTNRPGDNASVPRGIGTFAKNQPIDGIGIRPAKYSPNFNINNYTYAKTNGMHYVNQYGETVPHVHSIGFIWATMLWDLHWNYVEKYGYSSVVTNNMNSGSAKVLQVVMDGLKLQGCNPSFVAGRNAIIAADQAATNGANKCLIWLTFAKRGLGVNANPGLIKPVSSSATNVIAALNDQVEDFTYPAECTPLAAAETNAGRGVTLFPNPAKNEIFFKTLAKTQGKVFVTVYDLSGKLVLQDKIDLNSNSLNTSSLSNGVYMVKGEGMGVQFTEKVVINK